MLDKLFGNFKANLPFSESRIDPAVAHPSASAELAASLLVGPAALMQLSQQEGRVVVSYMQPHRIPAGVTFIREGDVQKNDYMLLILDGEVSVENFVVSRTTPVTVTVLGQGALLGEMGLLDGEPRSASCTTLTDLRCAVLTRGALQKLMVEDPLTAAKLMTSIALRLAARLRDASDKVRLYSQLTTAMQAEIDKLMPG